MPVKRKAPVKQRKPGSPHKRLRRNCKWCRKPRHNHTPIGDAHRFHGVGSFCATHATTVRGRRYCSGKKARAIRRHGKVTSHVFPGEKGYNNKRKR